MLLGVEINNMHSFKRTRLELEIKRQEITGQAEEMIDKRTKSEFLNTWG